ncbi:MAG TPA: SIR2 family protein [Saprospiraceae bacterium]|nr:SIR2 family protein [Saprospiraceae bacterium]
MLSSTEFERLAEAIQSGNCALVLGPEIFQSEGLPLHHHIREHLKGIFGDQVTAYERDGFFLLQNPDDKPEMKDEVLQLYKNLSPPRELLQRIVEIPFTVVLSVNPDTHLRDLSYASGLPCRFAWFDAAKHMELEMPDGSEATGSALRERIPLYYNLCGSVEKPSTLVLDYDDLFRLLTGMLGAPKLPEKLLDRLKDTTYYLFLGFQFDRWHTQLLLRLLEVKNAARRFAVQSPLPKEKDTEAFVLNQFRIRFLGNEADLIAQIHQHFKASGELRPTRNLQTPAAQDITVFLQKGNLEKALARLSDAASNTELANKAVLLSAQYHQWLNEKNKGTLDSRDVTLQFNQLTDRVLQAAQELEKA